MVSNLNLLESRRRILLTTPHLESPTPANPLTFKSNMSAKLKEGKVYFTPIQEGTGDPSPDNVRPILGWDGITVTKCGKNMIPPLSDTEFWNRDAYFNVNGRVVSNGNYKMCDFKPISPNANYAVSSFNSRWKGIGFYDASYSPLSFFEANSTSIQLSAPSDAKYYRVYVFWDTKETQMELDTPTAYEPYTETKITIPFPQTIYGGYVDLVNGEVVEEYEGADLSTVGFSQYGTSNHCWSSSIPGMVTGNQLTANDIFCDSYKPYSKASILWSGHDLGIWGYQTNQRRIIIRNDAYIGEDGKYDIEAFNESLKDKYLYYLLATPIHHTIDPQVIRPFKGTNTIWSDANGNIEIKFWKH